MEVLVAECELGEHECTFGDQYARTLKALEVKGYLTYRYGSFPRTRLAWITPQGLAAARPCGGTPVAVSTAPDSTVSGSDRWIVELFSYNVWNNYDTWMPVENAVYYATRQEAQTARDAIADTAYELAQRAHEQDIRECTERRAIQAAAAAAVKGMPQEKIITQIYCRTDPGEGPTRMTEAKMRAARVTTFQERVAAVLRESVGDRISVEDLRRCFHEVTDTSIER